MNPEEGELRPQILDRFPLSTLIKTVNQEEARVQIIKNNLLFEKDPPAFKNIFLDEENKTRERIAKAQALLPQIEIGEEIYYIAASLCAKLKVDGQRPDIVIVKTAFASAALHDRIRIKKEDLLKASFLALSHRTRDGGLEPPATEKEIQVAFEESSQKWGAFWKQKGVAGTAASEGESPADSGRVKKTPDLPG